ncbi:peptidoglycan-binding domain-containing protein [Streptomyces acidiscabies]|uniref:Peptidoglycan-binding domain-containing protein n=1 Tax=Streptomyces acidiscabies TaxID=42234 RepID=A0AAP6BI21_9ACTN|nr:peptidoglycan-binding domain-containing protein [Streptomyces acidiscabies]MBP5939084.1 peptidoglycan-binding protein [Streptomyces sp. LBUM 1476]MBZ3910197.1 peptidoglycan-binding protein [Streptomyces acidiscabies]MDX2965141.1 peptidoglycan-binding domain-containing protein [Streptomyces acidiscabies]MDX3023629.1 peptidoglycan-binding domain-containing protein [Streptomyces acidiscabies]MDX3789707.1 peptidoglycan-binding domain-containing protein [Streptomyces acidiscabies]
MNLKKIAGAAASVVMLAGLGTVATATNASASGNCYMIQYYNSDVAPRGYWVPDHNLSYAPGNHDACVEILQQELNEAYNAGLATDGYFGQNTLKYVRKFQGEFHCAGGVDGIVGHNTFSCLNWATGHYEV